MVKGRDELVLSVAEGSRPGHICYVASSILARLQTGIPARPADGEPLQIYTSRN